MTGLEIGMIAVVLMLALIYFGMHISIALMLVSFWQFLPCATRNWRHAWWLPPPTIRWEATSTGWCLCLS